METYRMLSMPMEEMSPYPISPVAEYRGAAIIECPGRVKKLYRGMEYATDGFTYLILCKSERPGHLTFVRFADERTVKLVLEQEGQPERFMSMAEVCEMLKMTPRLGPWVWCEDDGRFDEA